MHSNRPKTKAAIARASTRRSVLIWGLPLLAFAWLAVSAHGSAGRPAVPGGARLGGGAVANRFVPFASYKLHFTTVSLTNEGERVSIGSDRSFSGKDPLESTGNSTASGTWRVHVDVRSAETKKRADSCDSGPMRWAVRV